MLCSMCKFKQAVCEKNIDLGYGQVDVYLCKDCSEKVVENIKEPEAEVLDFWTTENCEITCHICKLTATQFEKSNYVGCERCYEVFQPEIERAVALVHGKTNHVGKVPEQILQQESKKVKLNQLSKQMQSIVNGSLNPKNAKDIRDKYLGGGI